MAVFDFALRAEVRVRKAFRFRGFGSRDGGLGALFVGRGDGGVAAVDGGAGRDENDGSLPF